MIRLARFLWEGAQKWGSGYFKASVPKMEIGDLQTRCNHGSIPRWKVAITGDRTEITYPGLLKKLIPGDILLFHLAAR